MQYQEGDTIVAPATPPGTGALAVVRISGPLAIPIAETIFSGRGLPLSANPRVALYGGVIDEEGRPIDEALLTCFPAPHSYTGEDSVEITCHGGPYLVRTIVERITGAGARLAGPGEFTRRAFLNGRIDLAQAESVADLIRARTEGAARSALKQLHGGLSNRLNELRAALLDLLAEVEADLDFAAEENVPSYDRERVLREVNGLREEFARLEMDGEKGRLLRDGVRIVLVGRPNSGKSTLFNALLGEERAIVSPEPGTTRDLLEGETEIGGILFHMSDTAGLREGTEGVEEEGVRRAKKRLEEADLQVVVIDRSEPLTTEDVEILDMSAGGKRVVVLTKSDLPAASPAGPPGCEEALVVSGLKGVGLEGLRKMLLKRVEGPDVDSLGDVVITSVRHLGAIRAAIVALDRAKRSIESGELLADDLREAIEQIGTITGEGTREDVLDRIFSKFCIGK